VTGHLPVSFSSNPSLHRLLEDNLKEKFANVRWLTPTTASDMRDTACDELYNSLQIIEGAYSAERASPRKIWDGTHPPTTLINKGDDFERGQRNGVQGG